MYSFIYIWILVRLLFAWIQLFFFSSYAQKEILGTQLAKFYASELIGVASPLSF